jgi:uncharacterized Zn-binding protein involved in type VI secretion
MPPVCRRGDRASCGHRSTGNSNVLINGRPASLNLRDRAGGLIIGPGTLNTRVNGLRLTTIGDRVKRHGKNKHKRARMIEASGNVGSY